jgi:four helix bundle protein
MLREGDMPSHKDLTVWKASMDLAEEVYFATRSFPREEQFGLVSQLRRSSASIPSNIAEGSARQGKGELLQFLHYSLGSSAELETQFELARRAALLSAKQFDKLDGELFKVRQLLRGLIMSIQKGKKKNLDD